MLAGGAIFKASLPCYRETWKLAEGLREARMTHQYSFGWVVWFLVVATLGPGCGDGDSDETPERNLGECGTQSGSTPSLEEPCGNGVVEAGCFEEECDDGNLRVYDACLPICVFARCGDGILRTEY